MQINVPDGKLAVITADDAARLFSAPLWSGSELWGVLVISGLQVQTTDEGVLHYPSMFGTLHLCALLDLELRGGTPMRVFNVEPGAYGLVERNLQKVGDSCPPIPTPQYEQVKFEDCALSVIEEYDTNNIVGLMYRVFSTLFDNPKIQWVDGYPQVYAMKKAAMPVNFKYWSLLKASYGNTAECLCYIDIMCCKSTPWKRGLWISPSYEQVVRIVYEACLAYKPYIGTAPIKRLKRSWATFQAVQSKGAKPVLATEDGALLLSTDDPTVR